eukprot:NODE_2098_length_1298_cov_71.337870_g1910_i0.p1 GENE.NODE_2098_length_1298_cov_71.337870_g1910_i0~~NODE_2098_length_1298_cov_71.337870_g1910_i0.p1  ORF type:complete len:264 (+),score=49.33 NODE_2098_length_1298_cov_71.337870_g1910_i0:156-947(+)
MEDVHHVVEDVTSEMNVDDFSLDPHAWFAVFDGHAGTESADNAKEHLLSDIVSNPFYRAARYSEAIVAGFSKTDQDFMKLFTEQKEQGKYAFRSGCTAVCALIIHDRLFAINLGDSRAVACCSGQAVQLTEDHKPWQKDENERIQQAGGHVLFNRVNGVLGVSRALGDFELKKTSKTAENLVVSNIPDVREFKIDSDASFLILGCDGVWDVVSNEEAVKAVNEVLGAEKSSKEAASRASQALVNLAMSKGSTDNISALVVSFH